MSEVESQAREDLSLALLERTNRRYCCGCAGCQATRAHELAILQHIHQQHGDLPAGKRGYAVELGGFADE